ncbi:polysaccharide biosynthesis protein [Fusobacterium hwasookii ChDC F174]|jgi:polysaccharide biosynthesis protein|uniref:Polysaccharide biosynthesis protein n=1 Tax=Fusobacterium hwasookii ChDC F174 TaxID=1307442 RepID=A0A0S2ZJU6_9FUSO|nr:oligosaccharide flippase family protein [Fusobacterium hwasookii]ALQ39158.1 polysaccharide biosynthesis protein [Fusobacterium hwasookii ChDC F174]
MEKNNLIKKFLSFSIGGYINILIGFFIVPITTRMLSPEQYGVSSLIDVIVQILVIATSLSMEQGFVRFFFEEEEENRGKLLYTSLVPFFILGALAFLLIFIFRKDISIFIVGKNENLIWICLILAILFRTINIFSFLVVRMKQRGSIFSILTVAVKLFEFIFILILFQYFGNDYKTLIFATIFANLMVAIVSIFFERKVWNLKNLSSLKDCKITKKELFNFSYPLILTMALNWLFASLDKITIRTFSNLNEVGIYSGAFKIVALLSVIQSGFSTFWTPTALEHYTKNPEDTSFYKKANDYLSLIFFLLGVNILLFRDVIGILLGKKFYNSIFVMPTLVFMPIMYLLSETTMIGIGFKKKTKYFLYVSVIASISNLIGNLFLVPYLGAKGAAISTGISYIVFFSARTYFSNKLINFGFNLKRIYIITFLILLYALFLSFYNKIYLTIGLGILLEIIILLIYYPIIKELYSKFIKKKER